ncbi:MAG: HYR domain-containing protein [Bacteroidota bacterium]
MRKVFLLCCWLFGFSFAHAQLTLDIGEIDTCTSSSITVDVPIIALQDVNLTALQFTINWDGSGLALNSWTTPLPNPIFGPVGGNPLNDTLTMSWSGTSISGVPFDAGDTLLLLTFTVTNPTAGNQYNVEFYNGPNTNFPFPLASGPNFATLNLSTLDGSVRIADDSPVLTNCPTDITVDNSPGQCGATVDFSPPSVVDCDNNTVDSPMASPMPNTFFDVGTTTVTYSVTDQSGNTGTCSFTVTVNDTEDPTLSCTPSDITVTVPAGTSSTVVTDPALVPTFDDNCPGESLSYTLSMATTTSSPVSGNANGATFNLGTTLVSYTVTDAVGNTTDCSFNVIVQEAGPQGNVTLDIADLSLQCCPTGPISVPIVILEDASLTALQFTIQWQGSNLSFNGITSVFDPLFLGPNGGNPLQDTLTVVWSGNMPSGQGVSAGDTLFTLSFDVTNCNLGDSYDVSFYSGSNTNYPQTLASGPNFFTLNTATLDGSVSVNAAPFGISCPTPTTLQLDANCEASLPDYTSQAIVNDVCGTTTTVTQSPPASTVISSNTTVKLVAENNLGDRDSCTFTVLVEDNIPPSISCPADQTLALDANCQVSLPDYTNATTSDNCDSAPMVSQSPAPGSNITAATAVKLVVVDQAGNRDSCEFQVMVADSTAPILSNCPVDMTVQTDSNCEYTIGDFTTGVNALDNCNANPVLTQMPPNGTIINRDTTVLLIATDQAGNQDSCRFNLTLQNDPLSISCPADQTVTGNQNCEGTLLDYTAQGTVSGGCGSTTVTQAPAAGTTFTTSSVVTLTVTDANGTSASCSFNVLVEDNTPPSITCPADQTIALDANCQVSLPDYTNAATSDNCDSTPAVSQRPAPGTSITANTAVTLLVVDQAGNRDSCEFQVMVADSTAPVLSNCPVDMTVQSDSNCEYTVGDFTSGVSAMDNCDANPMLTQIPASGTIVNGDTTVLIIATDQAGNQDSCRFNLDLQNDPPSITCPADQTATSNQNCEGTLADYTALAVVTGGCGNTTVTQDPAAGTSFTNSSVVTLTVTDANGASASCSFKVLIEDNTPPSISCPANTTIELDNNCTASVPAFTAAGLSDNCSSANDITVVQSPPAGTAISGTTPLTIKLVATDLVGNTDSCEFSLTPVDITPPSITCPSDITVNANGTSCTYTLDDFRSQTTVSDNCSSTQNITVSQSPAPGSAIGGGLQVVTLTATDEAGRSSSCTVNVTVNGSLSITCPTDKTVTADQNCQFTLADYTNDPEIVVDSPCAQLSSVNQQPAAGTIITGPTVVTLTAIDQAGNRDSCTFNVNPVDATPPVINCPADQTVALDASCIAQVPNLVGLASATDNCDGSSVTITQVSPIAGTFVTGSSVVTLRATDSQGNSSECTLQLIAVDEIAPTINCPANVTIGLDANCEATLIDFTNSAATTDNCSASQDIQIIQRPEAGSTINGPTTVILIALDEAGNIDSCSFQVVATDQAPSITCPADQTAAFDNNCAYSLLDYSNLVAVSDDCSTNLSVTQSPVAGTVITSSTVVTMTVTDENGQTGSCTFSVIPSDQTGPSVSCPADMTVDLDANCNYSIPDFTAAATSSDNCDNSPQITQNPSPGTVLSDPGSSTVTLIATDDAGNTGSCTFTISREDNTAPILTCPSDTTLNAPPGSSSVIVNNLTPTVNENCGMDRLIYTLSGATTGSGLNDASGSSFNLGTTLLTYTATDINGNTSSCTSRITVNGPFGIICPADTVVDQVAGGCNAIVNDIDLVIVDSLNLVAEFGYTLSGVTSGGDVGQASGTLFNVGVTTVTYTATDVDGNQIVCSFTVTVRDTEMPTLTCPADVVTDNANGFCSAAINAGLEPTSINDNCRIDSVWYELSGATMGNGVISANGSSFNVGQTTVTFFAKDRDGNVGQCSFTVTVNNTELASLSCPSDTIVQALSGTTAVVENIAPQVSSNCPAVITYTLSGATTGSGSDDASGSTFSEGVTTVTYSVDNGAGVVTCSFTVTITTNPDLMIDCPTDQVVGNDAGTCTAVVSGIGVTQNLPSVSIQSISYSLSGATTGSGSDDASGSTFNQGVTNVTYTVQTVDGQSESCSFTVTVEDREAPTIACPAASVFSECDPSQPLQPTLSDNCALGATTYSLSGATTGTGGGFVQTDQLNVGATIITYEISDLSGNSNTCIFAITINAAETLDISCPAVDNSYDTNPGNCFATVNDLEPSIRGGCAPTTLTYQISGATTGSGNGDPSGLTFNTGTSTIVYTVNSADGQQASCQVDVVVVDNENPSIVCPSDVAMTADTGLTSIVIDNIAPVSGSLSDNCGVAGVTYTLSGATTGSGNTDASGTEFQEGATLVTYTVTDLSGNTATCNFTVIVQAGPLPDLLDCVGNRGLDANGDCVGIPTDIAPILLTSGTNIASVTYELSGATTGSGVDDASGTRFNLGVTTVEYTVTSRFGTSETCTFTVTVTDRQNPVISNCPTDLTMDNDSGQCGANVNWTPPTATDNCQLNGLTSNFNPGDFFPVGTTTVVYTAVDGSGNESSCQFTITVNDTEMPVIECPPANLSFIPIGNCRAVLNWDAIRATDNCQLQSLTTSANPGDTFPVGITLPIIAVAVDNSGNMTNCNFEITITDNDPPELINCVPDVTLEADPLSCSAFYDWEGPTFNDCSNFSVDCSPLQGSNFPLGTTEVVCTATDRFGNSTECRFNVTVEDRTEPSVVCPENVVITADGAVRTDPSSIIESVSVDGNCESLEVIFRELDASDCTMVQQSVPSGNFDLGSVNALVYTFVDEAGNIKNCPFDLTIEDLPVFSIFVDNETPCAGDDIQFGINNAPNDGSLMWTGPDNFQSTNLQPIITNIQDEQSGTYTLTYTSPEGCTRTASVVVNVSGIPLFQAMANMIVCDGTLVLSAQEAAGSAMVSNWVWTDPEGNVIGQFDEITLSDLDASNSGTYTLTGSTSSGCTTTSVVEVDVLNISAPEVELECSGEVLCLGDGCTILGTPYNNAMGSVIQYNWTASPADGAGLPVMTNNNEIFVMPTAPGTYTFEYWVMIDSCTTDTVTTILNVGGRPDAVDDVYTLDTREGLNNFDVTENDTLLQALNPTVSLLERPSNGNLVLNTDGTYSYSPMNNFIGTDQFRYIVCYDCDNLVCDTATVTLEVGYNGECIIPTLITPNNDNINDRLQLLCLETGEFPDNELIIFNQWGDRVFRAQPYENNWEGTFNGEPGKDLPDGTYFFIFRADRNAAPQRGSITIFR